MSKSPSKPEAQSQLDTSAKVAIDTRSQLAKITDETDVVSDELAILKRTLVAQYNEWTMEKHRLTCPPLSKVIESFVNKKLVIAASYETPYLLMMPVMEYDSDKIIGYQPVIAEGRQMQDTKQQFGEVMYECDNLRRGDMEKADEIAEEMYRQHVGEEKFEEEMLNEVALDIVGRLLHGDDKDKQKIAEEALELMYEKYRRDELQYGDDSLLILRERVARRKQTMRDGESGMTRSRHKLLLIAAKKADKPIDLELSTILDDDYNPDTVHIDGILASSSDNCLSHLYPDAPNQMTRFRSSVVGDVIYDLNFIKP